MASLEGWSIDFDTKPRPAHLRIIERLQHLNGQVEEVMRFTGSVDASIARAGWAARTCMEICDRIVGTEFKSTAVQELVKELESHMTIYENHREVVAKTIDWLRRNYPHSV